MIKEYVLGFCFTRDKKKVVLISKLRPAWQNGSLNGIGGKVETYDNSPLDAMIREFKEETGVETLIADWDYFTKMIFPNDIMGGVAVVHCYRMFSNLAWQCKTTEEEEIILVDINELDKFDKISNLNFLIPLALDENVTLAEIEIK